MHDSCQVSELLELNRKRGVVTKDAIEVIFTF